MTVENILPPANLHANMPDYQAARESFSWHEVEKEFSWYQTGKLNIAHEAIDRHAEDRVTAGRYCLIFENEDRIERITYQQMRDLSNKFANVLRKLGVRKGDRVFIFLPRCPEYYVAMVGCAKIGAIFGPLFEALMEVAVGERLREGGAKVLVTTPKMAARVPFIDRSELEYLVLVGSQNMVMRPGEVSWEEEMARASYDCNIEWVDREDALYLIYTSGTGGGPKGVIHVHGDMIGQLITARWVLDLRDGDVVWTTAEPGWITGTVYGTFAPWLCGVENFVRGGRFDTRGWCKSIELHGVTVWYTAPTAFRRLMAEENVVKEYQLRTIRHILSVGEPLPHEVVYWSRRVLGAPVHDTWWMTETGIIMITNFPSLPIKPGSIGKPFPGIRAAVTDSDGQELSPLTLGELAIEEGWPGMFRGIWGDQPSYKSYFSRGSWYVSGDTAYMDEDGYFFFQGRDDELIKIAAVMVAPSEVEDVIRGHPAVSDAGVIGKYDPLKGNSIKAFIALNENYSPSERLKRELRTYVRNHFSPRMVPGEIDFRPHIPRSEEGVVIRRVLKAWDLGLTV